ncbi:hypothetical protein [uncultured Bacteroides sp.]|uniref:hypothetical protein n=1 Tax=uncultured Bacteroides sp. TaxID=162156 RepID=UPI0026170EBD|nr:hypothetical protein [uncultured Bacteroides sp.]
MIMDIGEIRRQYKYAKDRKKCVDILADLNCCSTGEILEIVHTERENQEERPKPAGWHPTPAQKAFMDRLDELDAMIKPLEDEYRRTAAELMRISEE